MEADQTPSVFYLRPDAPIKFLAPAYDDNGRLHLWVRQGSGDILAIYPADIVEGAYFARSKKLDTDFYFPFFSWAIQKANSHSHHRRLENILNDVSNLATSIEKLDLFYRSKNPGASAFARTEIEYVLIVCRSIFDLCQEMVAEWWSGVRLLDSTIKKRQLKASFADMVLHGGSVRPPESYSAFGLPEPWIAFYVKSAPFFLKIRDLRDGIVHRGTQMPTVFAGAPGFSVDVKDRLFTPFDIWKPDSLLKNNLGSLKTLVAFWILETLGTANNFMQVMQSTIALPEDIAPGYTMFFRGKHINHLNRLGAYLVNGWEDA